MLRTIEEKIDQILIAPFKIDTTMRKSMASVHNIVSKKGKSVIDFANLYKINEREESSDLKDKYDS